MLLIIITYLAGVLTILSPCILPVLPFVFAKSQKSFMRNGLPLLGGMCLTFSLFSSLAIAGGEWLSQANEIGRYLALILMSVFGISLIFPQLSEKILEPLSKIGSRIGSGNSDDSLKGSFLIGVSTGLLWAPCAGPILGLVLTGAAAQGNLTASVGLLFSYSLGAATSLAVALVAGNKFLGSLKKFLKVDQAVKKTLGVAVILGVLAIIFNLDRTVLTQISKVGTTNIESKLLSFADIQKKENSPVLEMPELNGAITWLNSQPLTKKDLEGKVVLIDFWTYSCINCIRTLPYVKAWAEKYKSDNFVVIGVHTPEFAFEKIVRNVENAIQDLDITYPVAVDNDYKIWNAFQNEYWPAHYFIDKKGRVRHIHFGEGDYANSEKIIQSLLLEGGGKITSSAFADPDLAGVQAPSVNAENESPETYLGYARAQNFSSHISMERDRVADYSARADLKLHHWALSGQWHIYGDASVLKKKGGKIRFKFYARDVHLVLGGPSKLKFKVTLDGKPPGLHHGLDIDKDGHGQIDNHRLYQLIRLKDSVSEHLFEIEFSSPEVAAYAFTFG